MRMATETQPRQPQRGLTFDDVWAMFQETDKKFQETAKRFKETEKLVKALSANVGGLNRSLGELIETLMAARLWEKFPQYNFEAASRRIQILDKNKRIVTEVDVMLVNTKWNMAVEVKREPTVNDITHHLRRMELLRKYRHEELKDKKLLGAIAGGVVSADVRDFAHKSGLYVLELNGEQVSLLESPKDFVALQG
jgi:predicted AAA+ superfamily ATPase